MTGIVVVAEGGVTMHLEGWERPRNRRVWFWRRPMDVARDWMAEVGVEPGPWAPAPLRQFAWFALLHEEER